MRCCSKHSDQPLRFGITVIIPAFQRTVSYREVKGLSQGHTASIVADLGIEPKKSGFRVHVGDIIPHLTLKKMSLRKVQSFIQSTKHSKVVKPGLKPSLPDSNILRFLIADLGVLLPLSNLGSD